MSKFNEKTCPYCAKLFKKMENGYHPDFLEVMRMISEVSRASWQPNSEQCTLQYPVFQPGSFCPNCG